MKSGSLALLWLVLAMLVLGCGKLSDPPPPASFEPAPAQDGLVRRKWSYRKYVSRTSTTKPNTSSSGSSGSSSSGSGSSSGGSIPTPTPTATTPTPAPTATTPTPAPTATAPAPTTPTPAPTGTDPYKWYPALDLNKIPFHVSDGSWGPKRPIQEPEAPKTTRSVVVTTAAELQAAVLVPGSEVKLGANIGQSVTIAGDITDVDLIIPPGITTVDMNIGRYSPPSKTTRLRIRGLTPGQHSGGRVGTLTFFSPTTDLIIDGIDMNGEDRQGGSLLWYFNGTVDRAAIVNVVGNAVGAGVLTNGGSDIVVAGCNFFTGARAREVNGQPEGWGMRFHARQVVVFRNRIDGTRYHRVRVHTASNETSIIHYSWISENTFVDPHEGRIVTAMGQEGATYEGFWATNNIAYAYSTCMAPEFDAGDYTKYGRVTGNRFYGNLGVLKNVGSLIDQTTGNTYSSWANPPAWGAPGDPNSIPLPALNPAKCQNAGCTAPNVCPGP